MNLMHVMAGNQRLIVLPRHLRWLARHGGEALLPNDGREGIGAMILTQMIEPPRDRTQSFSASSAGACERAQVFGFNGAEAEKPDPQLQSIFNDGKWRHLRWQAMLLQSGILTDIEVPQFWRRMLQRGTMDGQGIVPEDHYVEEWRGEPFGFELKGVNAFQYDGFVKSGPKEEHLNQVARYFLLSGLELFSIVYENKSTQAAHEWVVSRRDPGMAERIEEQRQEVESLKSYVDDGTLPPQLPECALGKGAWKKCQYGGNDGVCGFASTVADIEIHRERP